MVRHIVLIRFSLSCTAESIASIFSQLEKLKGVVPGLLNFHFGADVTPLPLSQGYTHGFTMDFQDAQSRDAYWEHPGHIAVAGQLVPLLDKGTDDILIFQFEF